MMPPVIVFATGCGTPRWRSTQARIVGPSLSRKNSASAVKESANASEAIPWIPCTMPCVRVLSDDDVDELTSEFALLADDESTPALSSQLWALAAAALASDLIWPLWSLMPAR